MGIAPKTRQASAALEKFGAMLAAETGSAAGAPAPDTTPPTAPTGLSTNSVTGSSIILSWVASTDDVGVEGYHLFLDGTEVGASPSTGYSFTGLSCGTPYTVGVAAYDAAGNLSGTATTSQSTAACPDTQPPSMPTGLAIGGLSSAAATLSWNSSTDNVGVTKYRLFLNGIQVGTSLTTNYFFSGLSCQTAYTFGVAASDDAGNVSPVATTTAQTAPCSDTQPPSMPTALATSGVGQTSVSVSWNPSSDNVGVAGYRLFLDGSQVGSSSSTSYSFTGLTCGTSHTFGVEAYDAAGNVSATATIMRSTSACPDTQPPSTPSNLTSGSVTQTSIKLSWNASTDNVGVAGYRVFVNGIQVGTSASTSFTFTSLTCATSYTLGVAAYDAAGNVSGTATLSHGTSVCPDTQPPSTPSGLASSAVGATSVSLSWNASTDNVGVAGYRLFLNGSQVGTSASTSYTFTGLSCGTSYTLGVAAYDAAANVSAIATLAGSTSACSSGGGVVYLSPSGSDGSCVRGDSSHPCATPAKAWAIAQSGDTIDVADGTYTSGCTLNGNKTASTTFVGSSSSNVKFVCDMQLNGADASFQSLGMYQFDDEANNVTLTNVDLACQNSAPYTLYSPGGKCSTTWNVSGNNFTWNGGSWGPLYDSESVCGGNSPNIPTIGIAAQPQNVTIERVYAHDVSVGCSSQHTELMRIDGGSNITLDRDFFHYCGNSACIFVSNQSGKVPSGITVRNSICDGTGLGGDCLDLNFGGTHGTVGSILENDTFLGGIAIEPADTYAKGDLTIANTIWPGANGCSSAPTYHNNAPYQPASGGTTDDCGGDPYQVAVGNHSDNEGPPSSWLACGALCGKGGIGLDYSVKVGSPLLHAGSASYVPALDYAGNTRPCAGQTQPNVGAYESACS